MQSEARTVDEYLTEIPEERRLILDQIRTAIREQIPELQESMAYGMPAYTRPGETEPEVAFASQVQHISLYLPVSVVATNKHLLTGLNVGKCCVRYRAAAKVDLAIMRELLLETARQNRA